MVDGEIEAPGNDQQTPRREEGVQVAHRLPRVDDVLKGLDTGNGVEATMQPGVVSVENVAHYINARPILLIEADVTILREQVADRTVHIVGADLQHPRLRLAAPRGPRP